MIREKVVGTICPETLRRIIVAAGIHWRPQKMWLWNTDLHYELKKKRVQALYESPLVETTVLCVDEKGPIAAKAYGGRHWAAKREVVARQQTIKGKVKLFGAYNPHTKELLGRTAERKDTGAFLSFLTVLEEEIPGEKQVIWMIFVPIMPRR